MKELGLDPKQYKFHSADDKSVTLQHKKGHTVRVALDVLSPKNKTILQALAKANQPQEQEPQKMFEGGEAYPPCLNPNCSSHGKPHPNCRCYGGKMAEGGKVSHFCSKEREHEEGCEYAKGGKVDAKRLGMSMQGIGVRHANMQVNSEAKNDSMHLAKEEAKGRRQEEKYIKPDIKGLAKGGPVKQESPGNMMPSEQCFDDGGIVDSAKKWFAGSFSTPEPTPPTSTTVKTPRSAGTAGPEGPQNKANGGEIKRQKYADKGLVTKDENGGIQDRSKDQPGAGDAIKHMAHSLMDWASRNDNKSLSDSSPQSPQPAPQATPQPQQPPMQDQGQQSNIPAQMPQEASQDQGLAPQQDETQDLPTSQTPSDINNPQPNLGNRAATLPTVYQPQAQAPNHPGIPQQGVTQQQADANELKNEAAAWEHDLVNGHVTPETYHDLFEKKSTLGKIGSLFGLMLGGFQSGLTHQPNVAMEMMNNEIQRDLQAQEKSKDNARNFLQMNYQHELQQAQARGIDVNNAATQQDIKDKALARSRILMNIAGTHDLIQNIDKMPEGPNKTAAKQALTMMYGQMNAQNADIADRYAMAKGMMSPSGDNLGGEQAYQARQNALRRSGQGDWANQNDERHIPGIGGQSSVPIPQGKKDEIHAMNVLDAKGKDLLSFVKQHRGTWNPQTRAQAEQKLEEMKNFYNGSIEGGALTQGRLKWYDEQFKKSPTDIMQQLMGSTKRLEEVVGSNQMRRDMSLKDLGFPKQVPMNQGQAEVPQIKTMGGVKFQKVPGGWQRVK